MIVIVMFQNGCLPGGLFSVNTPLLHADVLKGWGVSGTIGEQPALSVFKFHFR